MIDTDLIARSLLEKGQPALEEIKRKFGDSYFQPDGSLNRSDLAQLVFSDSSARQWLNEFLHPMIREQWKNKVADLKLVGTPLCVVVIPLLFETQAQHEFEVTVCVACSNQTQQMRLSERGWSKVHIQSRNDAQWSMARKMESSHYVVWTDCSKDTTIAQANIVFDDIKKRFSSQGI